MANTSYNPSGIGNLDPDDFNRYQRQRDQARRSYGIERAQNTYKRESADRRYSAGKSDLRRQYQRARGNFGSDLIQRGLLNSGLYKQAYRDLQVDRQQAGSDLLRNYQETTRGLDLANRQLLDLRTGALADIDATEQARRDSVAAALKYAKEFG